MASKEALNDRSFLYLASNRGGATHHVLKGSRGDIISHSVVDGSSPLSAHHCSALENGEQAETEEGRVVAFAVPFGEQHTVHQIQGPKISQELSRTATHALQHRAAPHSAYVSLARPSPSFGLSRHSCAPAPL